jgi:pimeloyl-ACP methyl ester carboxylesterase
MKILRNKAFFVSFLIVFCIILTALNTPCFAKKNKGPVEYTYKAKDGFNMAGLLDVPKTASTKSRVPLVILLHSLGESKGDWLEVPAKIKSLNYAVLNLDLRGHGLSINSQNSKKKYWQNFKNKEFAKYPQDINDALTSLRKDYPEINTGRVALVGANIGANAAVIAASKNNKAIKTLILISPYSSIKGLDASIPLVNYGVHPVFFIVSTPDRISYYDTTELMKYAQGKTVLKTYPSGGNGTDLIRFQPNSATLILNWLKTNI